MLLWWLGSGSGDRWTFGVCALGLERQGMMGWTAREVRSEEHIVFEEIRIRKVGMADMSLETQSSQDDILQMVVDQEEVAEANLGGYS